MTTKLTLSMELASALRAEAERTGKSQREIVAEAVSRHLQPVEARQATSDRDLARAAGLAQAARMPYRKVRPRLYLPEGTSSLDLLGR
jgi:predicted DNA-binding protein